MFGGTGLGLSIAQELTELHDGRITVDSTLGKGTEFSVILPSARKCLPGTLTAILMDQSQDLLHQSALNELEECAGTACRRQRTGNAELEKTDQLSTAV